MHFDPRKLPPTDSLPAVSGIVFKKLDWNPRFAIGNDGSVWSYRWIPKKWRKMIPALTGSQGELRPAVQVPHPTLRRTSWTVHLLVLYAFHGPKKPGQVGRHLDGDRFNNRATNLKWGTPKENAADRAKHGTFVIYPGESNGMSRLVADDVREIRRLYDLERTEKNKQKLADVFGISKTHVAQIANHHRWKHLN